MDRSELLDLIPAYALDALDPDEKEQVEALLKHDIEAQQLLADFQGIATSLILATPARRAPAHLQGDLRQRLAASRPAQPAPAKPLLQARRRIPVWVPLTAAAAIIALVFGMISLLNRNPAEQLYNQIKGMSGYKSVQIPSTDGNEPTVDMITSPDGNQAVIRMMQMPALQSNQTFQLWLIDDAGAHSGGLFPFTQANSTYYVIVPLKDKKAADYKAYGVSVEPSGGSTAPSTTPIVVISSI